MFIYGYMVIWLVIWLYMVIWLYGYMVGYMVGFQLIGDISIAGWWLKNILKNMKVNGK